jgi:hypothetical protein
MAATGAIFQLKATGVQDEFLTGTPQHNFLRQSYKQYINFAQDQLEFSPKESVDFGKKFTVEIPKLGDFVNKVYLYLRLPPLEVVSGEFVGWTNELGYSIIKRVTLEIGGCQIDEHYGTYMSIWEELTAQNYLENLLVGKYCHLSSMNKNARLETEYFIPMTFWFCQNLGASLPLFALRHNKVVLHFELRSFDECIVYDGSLPPLKVPILETKLLANYIYIDEIERKKMAETEFTFLITQVQSVLDVDLRSGLDHRIELPFNHPCTELIWAFREEDSELNNDWFNYSQRNNDYGTPILPFMSEARLVLDGKDRNTATKASVLSRVNIYNYHTSRSEKAIYTIPFCASPEKWFPTGSLNFSKISHATLNVTFVKGIQPVKANIFTRNFNLISIKNGEVFLAFSS